MKLTINAYSTALYSTWINLEEYDLLLDAGDGVAAGLLQKSRKVKHIFITHADRDHLTGLFQFNQLNARHGIPHIFYPKDCSTFPALKEFQRKFDPHMTEATWYPIEHGYRYQLRPDLYVEAIRNEHIKAEPGIAKSLSYRIFETKQKLKEEYLPLTSDEIERLMHEKGRENMLYDVTTNVLSYSGDTPVDDYSKWDGAEILMHESTFLAGEDQLRAEGKGSRHSFLDDVLKMVSEINVGKLILTHFSTRYKPEEIKPAVREFCKKLNIQIPVWVVYPGQIHWDLLNEEPVNA